MFNRVYWVNIDFESLINGQYLFQFLQYAFANDNNTHMAELDEGIEGDELSNYDDETVAKNRFRYANRQQVIKCGFNFVFISSE